MVLPITSVEDIAKVAKQLYDIISALNEARGSARDYRDLIRELQSLAFLLQNSSQIIDEYPNESLRSSVVTAVKQCCEVVGDAFEGTRSFDILGNEQRSGLGVGVRLRRGTAKIDDHHPYYVSLLYFCRWIATELSIEFQVYVQEARKGDARLVTMAADPSSRG